MRCRASVAVLLAATVASAWAQGTTAVVCGEPGGSALQRLESARYVVAYRPDQVPIEIGRHFAVQVFVCARGDAAPASGLRVDARMPAHGHGMNYRAVVRERGGGEFVAEGLLFHMPGRWEFVFEVEGPGGSDRITQGVVVE